MQTASTFPPAENVLQEIKWPLCSKDIKAGTTYQGQAPNCTLCATVAFSEQIQEQIFMDPLACEYTFLVIFAHKVSMTQAFQFQRNSH